MTPTPQLLVSSTTKSPVRRLQLEVECINSKNVACISLEDMQAIPLNFAFAGSSAWTILSKASVHDRPNELSQAIH